MVRSIFINEIKNDSYSFQVQASVDKTRIPREGGNTNYIYDDFTLGRYVLLTKEEYELVKSQLEEKKE